MNKGCCPCSAPVASPAQFPSFGGHGGHLTNTGVPFVGCASSDTSLPPSELSFFLALVKALSGDNRTAGLRWLGLFLPLLLPLSPSLSLPLFSSPSSISISPAEPSWFPSVQLGMGCTSRFGPVWNFLLPIDFDGFID